MQQINKPNYPTPSYEGLYFLKTNGNMKPICKGHIKRLLPDGRYIVDSCPMYDHLPIEKRVYIEETLASVFIQDADFFTNEDNLRLGIKRAIEAAEELENDEAAINPDTGEIVGFDELEQRKAKPKRMATDTITNGKKRLVKVTDNFPKRPKI